MKILMSRVLALKAVYETISQQVLPVKLSYKLSKLFAQILSESEFYVKEMNKILEQYAEKEENGQFKSVDNGNSIQIKPEFKEEATKKLIELNELEVDVPDIKFSLEELEVLHLPLKEFNLLMPFLEE